MTLALYLPARWALTTPDLSGLTNVWPLCAGQSFIKRRRFSWSTAVQTSVSGRELRSANYSAPRHGWEISQEYLRKKPPVTDEWSQIVAFVNAQRGQFAGWYYFDPTDNAVTAQAFGTGDGTATAFQLQRTVQALAGAGPAFTEPVYALNGTPTIYVAGTPTSAYTLNAYGVVTFASAPADGAALTWTGSFLWPCRFTSDDLEIQQDYQRIWSAQSIEWISLKP